MKCYNCSNDAVYTQADPGVNSVNYCPTCLPKWLNQRALAGEFPLVERIPKTTKKRTAPADEDN